MVQKSIHSRSLISLALVMLMFSLSLGPASASPEAIRGVNISNVRDVMFTVSWVTDSTTNGIVTYGTSIPPGTAVADGASSATTHYVEITGLIPSTTYYFQVSSGADVDNNGGAYYQVTTGPSISPPTPGYSIYGTVYQSDGTTTVPNAIVYLQLQDDDNNPSLGYSQLISIRTDLSGGWFYNLANVRTSNFLSYFSYTPGADNVRIIGQGGDKGAVGLDPSPLIVTLPAGILQQNLILIQSPTAVNLASFEGETLFNSVQLDWMTAHEVGLLGFNLYRSESLEGAKLKLNPSLIPAETPGTLNSNSYLYLDGKVEPGELYFYWLELVTQDGSQENGPVSLLIPHWLWLPTIEY